MNFVQNGVKANATIELSEETHVEIKSVSSNEVVLHVTSESNQTTTTNTPYGSDTQKTTNKTDETYKVDLSNRKILNGTAEGQYEALWIETDVSVGDKVMIGSFECEVTNVSAKYDPDTSKIGERTVIVVEYEKSEISGTFHYTMIIKMYYDKEYGLFLGAEATYSGTNTTGTYSISLYDTNVEFGGTNNVALYVVVGIVAVAVIGVVAYLFMKKKAEG